MVEMLGNKRRAQQKQEYGWSALRPITGKTELRSEKELWTMLPKGSNWNWVEAFRKGNSSNCNPNLRTLWSSENMYENVNRSSTALAPDVFVVDREGFVKLTLPRLYGNHYDTKFSQR